MTLRWLKFNAVGALGAVIQLGVLGLLHGWLRCEYPIATALAVEAAVLHNFVWHRLLRFNLSAGLVSILTNLALMRWLVGAHQTQYVFANLLSIAAGSVANFLASHLFVFRAHGRVCSVTTQPVAGRCGPRRGGSCS